MEAKKLLATVEKSESGYGAFIEKVPGVAAVGSSIDEVKESLQVALQMHVEGMLEDGESLPEALQEVYELAIKMDIESFFQWMGSVIPQSGLARACKMNRSLVAQYASGLKKPSPAQLKKLEEGIHQIGRDLLSVQF